FFQAEDGIRDFHVTGVQTCALPIYARRAAEDLAHLARRNVLGLPAERVAHAVDEIVVTERVLPQEVAGAEPQVALLDDVAEDLQTGRAACRERGSSEGGGV